jgi:hypothetical protein
MSLGTARHGGETVVLIDNLLDNLNSVIDDRECAGELGAVVEQLVNGTVAVLEADAALLVLLTEAETPALVASCYRQGLPEPVLESLVATACRAVQDGCTTVTVPGDPLSGSAAGPPATVLSVPLPAGDRCFGALSIFRLHPCAWEPDETRAAHAYARLLRLLLRHAAGAHRPRAGTDWGAPLLPQQALLSSSSHLDMERAWP